MLLSSLNGDRELFTGGVMLTWFTVGYAIGRMLW
jgi:hypothetical protein